MSISFLIKPASSSCNMRCTYCFYADVTDHREIKNYGIMSEETTEVVIIRAFEAAKRQITFAFQGGEPTLAGLDFFKNWVKLTKKHNTKKLPVHFAIQTNGMAIDQEWATFFHNNRFLVGISLDGPKEIHDHYRILSDGSGSYKKVLQAIDWLKKEHVDFNILSVVNQTVAKHPTKVYNFFKKQGFQYLQFIPCLDDLGQAQGTNPLSVTSERYGQFLIQLFDLWYRDWKAGSPVSIRMFDNVLQILLTGQPESCDMNGHCTVNAVVEADGSVYPCDFYVTDSWKLGNLHDSSLAELSQIPLATTFVEESLHTDPACKTCNHLHVCRGGCKRHKEPKVNGHYQSNIFCSAYKKFYDATATRFLEIARTETGR
ncbi:SPASM domain-containing protein [Gottschalkiaceae bacterium SANA]|nr:SPASM domain-containing protein [Gottschalkiaceae bacterium SANA]